jgi:hypothetical protein
MAKSPSSLTLRDTPGIEPCRSPGRRAAAILADLEHRSVVLFVSITLISPLFNHLKFESHPHFQPPL